MLPFAWPHLQNDWPTIRAEWKRLGVLALTGIAIYHVISYYALGKTQAINALLIQSSGPLFVALWGLLLYGVRLSMRQALGIAVSLTGVLVIVLRGDIVDAGGGRFQRRRRLVPAGHDDLRHLLHGEAAKDAPIVAARDDNGSRGRDAAALRHPRSGLHQATAVDATMWLSFLYVISFPSAIAYLFFNRGVELIGPNRAAPFFHLQPVFGSVLAVTLLGESFRLFHLAGYALVLAGVFTAARK